MSSLRDVRRRTRFDEQRQQTVRNVIACIGWVGNALSRQMAGPPDFTSTVTGTPIAGVRPGQQHRGIGVQSKWGPRSVLRPGDIRNDRRCAGRRYCRTVRKSRRSGPARRYMDVGERRSSPASSSMPTEKSLQRSRPPKADWPACQARRFNGTNWTGGRHRAGSAGGETVRSAMDAK